MMFVTLKYATADTNFIWNVYSFVSSHLPDWLPLTFRDLQIEGDAYFDTQ
jgi:hypothetical protein